MVWFWVVTLVLVLAAGWLLTLLGMPGTWVIVAAAAVYTQFGPATGRPAIGWSVVFVLLALAVVGELLEFLAGALGAARGGGSKRGAALAIVGSLVGGMLGLLVGTPIPVVGSLLAAVLFAAVGALLGALVGERWKGRDWGPSWQVGTAAFWGRLLGTAAKLAVATVMVLLTVAAMIASY